MSLDIGAYGKAIYGKETTWGTAVTPSKYFDHVTEIPPPWSRDIERKYALVESREPKFLRPGLKTYEGRISGIFTREDLLLYILGKIETSGSGPYTHTLTPGSSLPSITLEMGIDNVKVWKLVGVVFGSMEISAEVGEYLSFSIDYIAKTLSELSTFSANVDVGGNTPFDWSMATITLGGSDITDKVESIRISLNNNIEGLSALGSEEIVKVRIGRFEAEAEIRFIQFDNSIYSLKDSENDLIVKFARGANDYIQFTLGGCRIASPDVGLSAEDLVGLTLPLIVKTTSVEIKNSEATLE